MSLITITTTGNVEKALQRRIEQIKRNNRSAAVRSIAHQGKSRLAEATPVDTGETASSWDVKVENSQQDVTITYSNNHLTKDRVPVVTLLRYGHATGTGGYVRPNDFITPVVNQTMKKLAEHTARK